VKKYIYVPASIADDLSEFVSNYSETEIKELIVKHKKKDKKNGKSKKA
jgi:hypothetical protein